MMNDKDKEFYGKFADRIEALKENIESKISQMSLSVSGTEEERSVEHILGRIKNSESIKEKLQRKNLPTEVEAALVNLSDVIGFRCVTHFVGNVYALSTLIENEKTWEVVEVKDYIASPKENGYRSLHIIIAVPFDDEFIKYVRVEIQLRTIAMDCWAALEHEMRYKKDIDNTKLISSELKRCADEMASTDLSMQTIKDMIRGEF